MREIAERLEGGDMKTALTAERRLRAVERVYRNNAARAERSRLRRNATIREALATGMRQSEVARITGLNRSRIGQIAGSGSDE